MKTHTITIRAVSGQSAIDKLIQWRTDCIYNHVEFLWPFVDSPDWRHYRKYGDGKTGWLGAQPIGGVKIRPFYYLGHSVTEKLFDVKVTENQMLDIREYALDAINEPYDYQAIWENAANSTLKLFSHKKHADCSEFVSSALQAGGVNLFNWHSWNSVKTYTPRDVIISHLLKARK